MSFMQINGIDDVQEPEIAPDAEYSLKITKVEPYVNEKTGRDIVKCTIVFMDYDEYAPFNFWLALPNQKLDIDGHEDGPEAGQKKFNNMVLNVKRFLHLWNVSINDSGFDPMDLLGCEALAPVTSETDDEDRTFQRLIVPRIRDEKKG